MFAPKRGEMRRLAVGHEQVAAGNRSRDQESARFKAVGIDPMTRTVQFIHALHTNRCSSRAFNFGAHGDQQSGKVGDFRLAGAVLHQCFAFGQHCRHQQVFCASNGDVVEDNMLTLEPISASFK
jgi:hypothetical protein